VEIAQGQRPGGVKPVIGFAPLLTMIFLTDSAARAPGFSPLSPDELRTRRICVTSG
jgi:hypothetical protein